jgi:glucosyl-3-phosphoglycerate synthase
MISVIIPALNEAANIAGVIELARRSAGVCEVIVVDDGSVDGTPDVASPAGAMVITSSMLGKGASMDDGLKASRGEIVVYLDGDLTGLDERVVELIAAPIQSGSADFVKARFSRSAGRVTTLTAKPLIATFFPELAKFEQPLGGIIAARRELLESLTFEPDYGVDLALLIDASFAGARVVEVDIGHLEHDSQTLEALGDMATHVVRALLHRAGRYRRLSLRQVQEVEEVERHANAEFSLVMRNMHSEQKLALFDMDGTLLRARSVVAVAERTGRMQALRRYLDNSALTAMERTEWIADCLKGVSRQVFVDIARSLPLSVGAVETVIALRKRGYRVGIVSDSYRIITEVVRRRVFADFSVSNLLRFRQGRATGEITVSPIFLHDSGCPEHELCKWNVLMHLEEKLSISSENVLAVGDSANDLCLLRRAGVGIAFEPKTEALGRVANRVIHGDMRQVLDHCLDPATAACGE